MCFEYFFQIFSRTTSFKCENYAHLLYADLPKLIYTHVTLPHCVFAMVAHKILFVHIVFVLFKRLILLSGVCTLEIVSFFCSLYSELCLYVFKSKDYYIQYSRMRTEKRLLPSVVQRISSFSTRKLFLALRLSSQ